MTSLTLENLQLVRGHGPSRFQLGPLDLSIASGTRAALIGPSGCGKTTLLRCIAGLETRCSGKIRIGGRTVQDHDTYVDPAARRIGFVFQDGALWPHMTAIQHLRFVTRGLSKAAARGLLADVGIEHAAERKPGSLSGGEAQRLALARALAQQPDLLLLDEPLRSVDADRRDQLGLLIRRIAVQRSLTLLVVTHDRDEALAMADQLLVLEQGKIVDAGLAIDVIGQPKTAFCATFLARAACVPMQHCGPGLLRCALGTFDGTFDPDQPYSLALLPSDVALEPHGSEGALSVDVLQVHPGPGGLVARIAIGESTLEVACPKSIRPGESAWLRLVGAPRILTRSSSSTSYRGES